ncbi:MAG: alpha/beta hydrolase fold domain-containing protein [Ruminococcus sp.]|nr:alpha/beta hydrolase fold domain-containing protein [Ruminococcus sp.]
MSNTSVTEKRIIAWIFTRKKGIQSICRCLLIFTEAVCFSGRKRSTDCTVQICVAVASPFFCVEYPLVPDNDIFSILRDITAAVNFVDEIASEYGGDPSRLYMCGDSAGAYLCVYLSAIQNNNDIAVAA